MIKCMAIGTIRSLNNMGTSLWNLNDFWVTRGLTLVPLRTSWSQGPPDTKPIHGAQVGGAVADLSFDSCDPAVNSPRVELIISLGEVIDPELLLRWTWVSFCSFSGPVYSACLCFLGGIVLYLLGVYWEGLLTKQYLETVTMLASPVSLSHRWKWGTMP